MKFNRTCFIIIYIVQFRFKFDRRNKFSFDLFIKRICSVTVSVFTDLKNPGSVIQSQ